MKNKRQRLLGFLAKILRIGDKVLLECDLSQEMEQDPMVTEAEAPPAKSPKPKIQGLKKPGKIPSNTKVTRNREGAEAWARWSSEDDAYLWSHRHDSVDSLMRVLGRSKSAIYQRKTVLKKKRLARGLRTR